MKLIRNFNDLLTLSRYCRIFEYRVAVGGNGYSKRGYYLSIIDNNDEFILDTVIENRFYMSRNVVRLSLGFMKDVAVTLSDGSRHLVFIDRNPRPF